MDIDLFGRHRVVLRRPAGARPRAATRSSVCDVEVAVAGELVEVMAGNIRMDVEQRCDVGRSHGFRRLADGDVDGASCWVAESGSEVTDRLAEVPGVCGNGLRHDENYSSALLVNTTHIGETWPTRRT